MPYRNEITLEICVDQLALAMSAAALAADRIELCSGLTEGGLTPPQSLIEAVCHNLMIPVHVMIRPRAGDFLYSPGEFGLMKQDVRNARKAGAAGVVYGILNEDGTIDQDRCAELKELAAPMHVTFHRAFDMTADPFRSLEVLVSLGIPSLLTSGQCQTAEDGLEMIRELVKRAAGRIQVMAGGGVKSSNARLLYEAGIRCFHMTARKFAPGKMKFHNPALHNMGGPPPDEYDTAVPDIEKVNQLLQVLSGS